jgi:cytochrome c-type biogenesis protein CcmF
MVLGTGIIMGGFWAYESLSFGGYWAWDPVENASLVPWLILIAGVHVMIIYKHSGNSLSVAYILIITTFLLVLYATFLTRSGILGNSSVHSFTDLGMSGQLLVFLLIFVILSIVLMVVRWKSIPKSYKDEDIYTREFWMFIGSLVLVILRFSGNIDYINSSIQ